VLAKLEEIGKLKAFGSITGDFTTKAMNIIEFLKSGDNLYGISLGMPVNAVFEKFGSDLERVGDEIQGYLYFKELRFGYSDGIINEVAIVFTEQIRPVYEIKIDLLEFVKQLTVIPCCIILF